MHAENLCTTCYKPVPANEYTCPHCGATNPATAHQCSQCGGPLGEKEPEKLKPKPKPQPTKRRRLPIVAILAVALVICGLLFAITQFSRSEVVGVVDRLAWRTTIQIQALGPVAREDWHDRVPASALRQGCTPKVRHTVSDPVPGAIEVCGTPYVVDTGTGQGQVMQDCVYQVREDWCRYTVNEWRAAGERVATGENSQPHWPQVSLTANQREAGRAATYIVVFIADDQERRLTVSNAEQWLQYEVGSEWILEINALGGITSLRPAD